MKPHIDTWIGPALTPASMTSRHTTISKAGTHISVSGSDLVEPSDQNVISVYMGVTTARFDLDVARAVAQAILAAADHYDAQIAALATTEAS